MQCLGLFLSKVLPSVQSLCLFVKPFVKSGSLKILWSLFDCTVNTIHWVDFLFPDVMVTSVLLEQWHQVVEVVIELQVQSQVEAL